MPPASVPNSLTRSAIGGEHVTPKVTEELGLLREKRSWWEFVLTYLWRGRNMVARVINLISRK